MMRALCCLAAAFFLAAPPHPAGAEDDPIRISVSADPVRLPPGSVFTLTVTIEGAGLTSLPEPRLGRLTNFEILGTSKNQQVSLVNGEMTVTRSVAYRVRALKEGVYDIPPASAVYEGAVYQTKSITITVDPAAAPPPAPAAPGAPPGMGALPFPSLDRMFGSSAAPRIGKNDLRVFMTLDKKEAVPFEPVVATFSFARAVDLWNSPQFVRPKFEGFWVEETPFENGKMELTVQDTIDGKRYTVSKIRFTLVPLAPGNLTVDPAGLLIAASPWTGPIELRTERIPLAIHPFPEKDKPADFTGLVAGGLVLKSIVTPPSARAGESVTLRVTMEGNGYFKPAGPPPPPKADGAGVYDPSVKDQTFKSSGALVSRREVEYPVTLTREGRVTLPPVSVAVFDLKTRSYQRYAAEPLQVTALPGDARAVEKTPLLAPRPLRAVAGELKDH
ncbi:MAG: BatD family protein, partial [Nitrospinae bacterium]|nr:BatD family protein [Nitrospinota bacterium]